MANFCPICQDLYSSEMSKCPRCGKIPIGKLVEKISTDPVFYKKLINDPNSALKDFDESLHTFTPQEAVSAILGRKFNDSLYINNTRDPKSCTQTTCGDTCAGSTCNVNTCSGQSCLSTCVGFSCQLETCNDESCWRTCSAVSCADTCVRSESTCNYTCTPGSCVGTCSGESCDATCATAPTCTSTCSGQSCESTCDAHGTCTTTCSGESCDDTKGPNTTIKYNDNFLQQKVYFKPRNRFEPSDK